MIRPVAALVTLYGLMPTTASSQQLNIVLPGETPLQQTVGAAVLNMCLTLDALASPASAAAPLTSLQHDLHVQCHAIVLADLSTPAGTTSPAVLGALQQVSGNQVSAQGSLATRVVGGQFANISGRLNALRLGISSSIAQGRVAGLDDGAPASRGSLAFGGPQRFYLDRSVLDSSARGDGFAPDIAPPVRGGQAALSRAEFVPHGALQRARSDSSAAAEDAGGGGNVAPLPGPTSPWGLFVQGSYNSGRHDATVNEDPFDFHASSVTAGIDYNFGTAVLGASIGYDDYNAGFGTVGTTLSGGSARVEGTSGSLYGAWFGQHWLLNGIATYGKLTTNVTRNVQYTVTYDKTLDPQPDINDNCGATTCTVTVDRTLRGDPSGHSYAVGVTAGYQYTADSWDIVPSLSASYRRANINSFAETDPNPPPGGDGLPIAFGSQTVESLRSILGLDVSRAFSASFGILTPVVRVEWDHEYKNAARTTDAHYANDPTAATTCLSCFALPSDTTSANYAIAGAGVSVTLAHRIQAFVYDEVLLGFANYRSNSIAVGVRGQL
jgi:uncharacterized protein YhjY with autotransporter beta-barrel domain